MEAKEYRMVAGRRKRRSKKEKLIDESNWRFEIVKVNEAFQVCRYYRLSFIFFFQIIGWCELISVLDVAIYKILLLVLLKLPQPSTVVSVSIDHSKLNIPFQLA